MKTVALKFYTILFFFLLTWFLIWDSWTDIRDIKEILIGWRQ